MPWRERSVVELRKEFVILSLAKGANRSELCRRFGISRDKGYKWLKRYTAEGEAGLDDRSRRPKRSPLRTEAAVEARVLAIRAESNGAWGGRKIARVLKDEEQLIVAPSTVTSVLRRHGKLNRAAKEHPGPFERFERKTPNELWQMDFKGHLPLVQGRCHPLTTLDDHSRYALGLEACADEKDATVRERLTRIFRRYGMPFAMLMDNGAPWGDTGDQPITVFTLWLNRLGIRVIHGRPYHPQTQGKDERFHRTLKAEILNGNSFCDLAECQRSFDKWRQIYNYRRPHEALGMSTPATRYYVSPRPFPEHLPPIEYGPGDIVRIVDCNGNARFKGYRIKMGKPFRNQPIAFRPTDTDGVFSAYFCVQPIATIDLRSATTSCGFVDIARAMPTTPQSQQQEKRV